MRKLTYFIASTIDGFIAGPDRSDPTGPGGFWPIGPDYVQHLVAEYPETLPGGARDALGVTTPNARFDTVLEGRRSYEIGLAAGVADAYPHQRHIVFSRTLTEVGGDVEMVSTDPVEFVRALKREEGLGIWLVGGGDLAGALLDEIDELVVKLSPTTIGSGVPLFGDRREFGPQFWTLDGIEALPSGTIFLSYGRPTTTATE